ncbi:NAD(P)-dependent oxidoreductase [Silicimonas sp. MF1-12-2]|uniref:NAD(P)-dependent oxidoreductase n=1 Tax=Silicimonas sp. MF1-12-2 TaxID=3384793 RepID=UPI0039B4D1AA
MGKVGIIGLGIMGSAYAKNLIKGGVSVEGADPLPEARERLAGMGGVAHQAAGEWLADCDLVITSLISPAILHEITETLVRVLKPGQVVMETGTFALADKMAAHDALVAAGLRPLDCPVSGTGAQAAVADLVMMASGDSEAIAHAKPYLSHITKKVIEAGPYGMGSRLKYIANHAVVLHNTAAAETLAYADALGMDRQMVYDMLSSGAGQSKMSDLRMPLMISGQYEPPTASLKMFRKDVTVIGDDIRRLGLSMPLFEAATERYETAFSSVPNTYDAAAVFEAYRTKPRE